MDNGSGWALISDQQKVCNTLLSLILKLFVTLYIMFISFNIFFFRFMYLSGSNPFGC